MQYPVGMEFDPAQMRNVMDDFWALFSGIAINKFFHAVFSGWARRRVRDRCQLLHALEAPQTATSPSSRSERLHGSGLSD